MAIRKLDELYTVDSKGKTRVWYVEIDGDKIRNVAGIYGGNLVESGWKLMKAKNVGKVNESTPEQQAEVEAAALYDKQLAQGGYHRDIANASISTYFEPMLAKTYADMVPIDYKQAVFSQPKLDGHRCIARADGLYTRQGKVYMSVPHISMALYDFFKANPDAVLDGELYNHDLKDDFNQLSSIVRKQKPDLADLEKSADVIQYHIYDIFIADMSFSNRFGALSRMFDANDFPDCLQLVDTTYVSDQEELDTLYATYLTNRYEGQMVRYNRAYENKRSKHLIKRKEFFDQEYRILDVVEGEGNWAGLAKSLTIELEDGTQASSGIRGNREFAAKLLVNKHLYVGTGYATVRFPNKTPDGKPRFPVAVDLHQGKRAD